MPTSGQATFDPTSAETLEEAFERCEMDPEQLGLRHITSARRSSNFILKSWATVGILNFATEPANFTTTQGDFDITLPADTVDISNVFVRDTTGLDTPLYPMTRQEYAAITEKDAENLPAYYYVDRQAVPVLYLHPAPRNSTDVIRYTKHRKLDDVLSASETIDVPSHWQEAFVAELASQLAVKFKADKVKLLSEIAAARFQAAREADKQRAVKLLENVEGDNG